MMDPSPPDRSAEERFIEYLVQLHGRGDRGALAALRRVLGRDLGDVPAADRVILPWVPPTTSDRRAKAWYLVAGLFASHPMSDTAGGSFAWSFRRFCEAHPRSSLEQRFQALLQAHVDEMPDHLRRLVQLLRAANIPVDWVRLLRDVKAWNDPERRVQRRWARDFWAVAPTVAKAESPTDRSQQEEIADAS